MALARLCLKRSPLVHPNLLSPRTSRPLAALFNGPPPLSYSSAAEETQVTISEKPPSPSRRRKQRRGLLPWKSPLNNLPFSLGGGLGHALVDASDTLSNLLENLNPSRWLGQVKQDDKWYKMRYEVPGLSKDDLKITVDGQYLIITGEHKEEEGGVDEGWYARESYNASLMLPDDADVEGIKAEVKNGVLTLTIPRSEEKKRSVKEVQIE